MEELAKLVPPNAGWIIAGWAVTAAIAMGTLLYKGIWKRINQLAEDQDETRTDLDRQIGACSARNPSGTVSWCGPERRKAKRTTDDE